MAQVSIIAYFVAGALLSMSYWDFYFTLLVVVAATDRCVNTALQTRALGGPKPTAITPYSWRARVPAAVG
jgi:hypothetical protein